MKGVLHYCYTNKKAPLWGLIFTNVDSDVRVLGLVEQVVAECQMLPVNLGSLCLRSSGKHGYGLGAYVQR